MSHITKVDRRTFIRRGAMGAGALWALSLGEFVARRAEAAIPSPYGPVSPKLDETTGLPLLQLPDGFHYKSFSWTGDMMDDEVLVPPAHDGMAVVDMQGNSGRIILVRNHEAGSGVPYVVKPSITYAADGAGGTTNIIFNQRRGQWEKAWSSLAGTNRNCAGGVTPWGTWITGEETTVEGHGWQFEVGAQNGDPTPLVDMGRFSHEACMVDPDTGYAYETEDAGSTSGFYRYVPHVPGAFKQGGTLYMLKVKGEPNANLGAAFPIGTMWDVEWVPIADPAAGTMSPFAQGAALGAAAFRRLEGCWWSDTTGFFLSTDGGVKREGQVFEYDPNAETLKLIYDSPSFLECDNPDNLVVTPRGGLILCEDAASGEGNVAAERLIGLTLAGGAFTFAMNNVVLAVAHNARVAAGDYRNQEFAGACYSPDGQWLFCNIQTPGITFAITGPWGAGPL